MFSVYDKDWFFSESERGRGSGFPAIAVLDVSHEGCLAFPSALFLYGRDARAPVDCCRGEALSE